MCVYTYGTAREQVHSMHRLTRILHKIFARHKELPAFHTQVSRMLAHASTRSHSAKFQSDSICYVANLLRSYLCTWYVANSLAMYL